MLTSALIGCGFFAINQFNAWRDIADGDGTAAIVAICDSNPARLADVAAQFGIERTYRDATELFRQETLDFVDICTTAPSHRPLVELPATSGRDNMKTSALVEAAYRSDVDGSSAAPGSLL